MSIIYVILNSKSIVMVLILSNNFFILLGFDNPTHRFVWTINPFIVNPLVLGVHQKVTHT